ncbi:MAG: tetraacyldisaccharide 4'-kinase [Methylococcales bacterium]
MTRAEFSNWLERQWYERAGVIRLLVPLSWLFTWGASLRRALYAWGWLKSSGPDCLVIVVGNITVGGTGKTPLVIWLAGFLKQQGWKPGIVSRGYKGRSSRAPRRVTPESDPRVVGDEAVLIARHTACPMAVGRDRAVAALRLEKETPCDIIVADDGLQHYALKRDLEIAVVDAARLFGNGLCLPAGPLRERKNRLEQVDLVVYNGGREAQAFEMKLAGDVAVNNVRPDIRVALREFASKPCHALAGIGNPERFFNFLKARGLCFDTRAFPDHHEFGSEDLYFADHRPVLMTEKDAVKCSSFSAPNHWYVPVQAQLEREFELRLLQLLEIKRR